jgi:hypothetical protein
VISGRESLGQVARDFVNRHGWDALPLGGERWYGNTRSGAYVCQREADRAGDRASLRIPVNVISRTG